MMNNPEAFKRAKQAAAKAAAEIIQSGMLIGLGTGSTAAFFIEALIERCRNQSLNVRVFPTSERSAKLALAGGIPLCDDRTVQLDLAVDGADEIDPQKRMIKGGGGALLREKIIAGMSREMIVIADQNKLVEHLGGFPLPLEIIPFARHATFNKIQTLGYNASFRCSESGELFITDNGNTIIDIKFHEKCLSPEKDQAILNEIPGVVETGFFFNLAGRIFVGQFDGTVKIIE